jgi:hypothetical protein
MADMTFTNMDLPKIIKVAQSMQGMQENSIHTYYVPSSPDDSTGISYVIVTESAWRQLITALDAGEYPDHQVENYAGIVPEGYIANTEIIATDQLAGQTSAVDPAGYVVDVRNGGGIEGSATSVSDMLVLAGYDRGEIGNANSYVYDTTLVIYQDEQDKSVAEDIRRRLGYGSIIASLGRYEFSGDILVVVGGDFSP